MVGTLVDPVREGGQRGSHPALGVVEDAVEQRERPLHGDLLGELGDAFGPDAGRADHRAQVAVLELRGARVREQQPPQVAAGLAARDELEGGQPHSLLPGVVGERVVGAGRAAADVGLVGPVAAERDTPTADEHRARDDPVGQVVAAGLPGVVEHEDVAGLDVVGEVAQHRAHREAAPAGVDRDPVRLRDQPAVRSAHEAGEVVGLAEDGASRGAHHHLAHLPGDVVQAVLGEGELDGVEGCHVRGRHSGGAVCQLGLALQVARHGIGDLGSPPAGRVVDDDCTDSIPRFRWKVGGHVDAAKVHRGDGVAQYTKRLPRRLGGAGRRAVRGVGTKPPCGRSR